MERRSQETYQIATLVVVILTVLVCMSYLLIFFNPQIALNPLKPALPTATSVVLGLVPTWTPTLTATPTRTLTPTPTPTITDTPLPTNTPSRTPSPTPTRKPTARPATPVPVVPTQVAFQYAYASQKKCYHSGGTFIEGTVWSGYGGYGQNGVRVAMSSAPNSGAAIYYATTGNSGGRDGFYVHVLSANGARPGTYYVWVVDGNGLALSDPSQGLVTTNNAGPYDSNACWRAVVDFFHR